MATLTPPPDTPAGRPRNTRAGNAGVFVGSIVALIVCVVVSAFVVLSAPGIFNGGSTSHTRADCVAGAAWGVLYAVLAIGLGVLAWYVTVRVRGTGFGIGFVKGLVVMAAIFNLAPWPCSLVGAAFFSFSGCR
jgi:hypothetical protein